MNVDRIESKAGSNGYSMSERPGMGNNPIAILKRIFTSEPRPSLAEKLELLEQRIHDDQRDADARLRRRR